MLCCSVAMSYDPCSLVQHGASRHRPVWVPPSRWPDYTNRWGDMVGFLDDQMTWLENMETYCEERSSALEWDFHPTHPAWQCKKWSQSTCFDSHRNILKIAVEWFPFPGLSILLSSESCSPAPLLKMPSATISNNTNIHSIMNEIEDWLSYQS